MEKLNEEVLLKTPVFDVVKKTFKGTSFQPVGLKAKNWVTVVVYDDSGKCILVKQTRWGSEQKTVEFPCGTVEEGETAIKAGLREFKEETGIELNENKVRLVAHLNPNPAYFDNVFSIYACEVGNVRLFFEHRYEQSLDKNEDCEVFVGDITDVLLGSYSHGLMVAAYGLVWRNIARTRLETIKDLC